MRMLTVLVCLGLLVVNTMFGQGAKGFPKIETEVIGKSKLSVYYQLNDNSTKDRKSTQTVLQLFDSKSKFFDVNEVDAIAYNNEFLTGGLNSENIAKGRNIFAKYFYKSIVLKDFSTSKLVVNDQISGFRFQYEESIPKIKWKIEKETKELLGRQCIKATARFRGRDYVAWYTEELPISDGPFLFSGLPGLILEIRDTKDEYIFIANGIEQKNEDVFKTIHPKLTKTDRESFRRGVKNDRLDPGAALQGKIYTEPGKLANTSGMKPLPYNPIELE